MESDALSERGREVRLRRWEAVAILGETLLAVVGAFAIVGWVSRGTRPLAQAIFSAGGFLLIASLLLPVYSVAARSYGTREIVPRAWIGAAIATAAIVGAVVFFIR